VLYALFSATSMSSQSRFARVSAPASDLEWCHDAVQGVSRTFALTIRVLEEPMSSYICLGYLLCRVPDTIEDASHIPPEEQADLLHAYDRVLDPADDYDADTFRDAIDPWLPPADDRSEDWQVVASTPRVIRTFEALPADVRDAMRGPARELVVGMEVFVERYADEGGLRLETVDELELYCYYAAGTVGQLITNLVCRGDVPEATEDRLYGTAESFGLLLQLVNVAKDVYVDFREEDNVYLPAVWFEAEGVSQEAIDDPANEAGVAAIVRRTAEHARTFIDDAQAYLEHVPETDGNRLAAWAIPFLLAVGTLRELTDRPEDAVSEEGVKVSRREVEAIVAAMSGTHERDRVGELRQAIADQPFHQTDEQS
jgi:farnesyl-diphosphate farnesyltransferase